MPPNRLPYFRFDVQSYLTDPAVLGMDADAEGCYIRLLARMWQSPTPGRVAEHLVDEMSGLYRITDHLAPDTHEGFIDSLGNGHRRREIVVEQMAAAFDTESDPGYWLQRRMTVEWRLTQSNARAREKGAAVTNERRWGKVAKRSLSGRSAVGNREVEVEVEESTQDSKEERTSGPSARCLARCRERFPKLDLPIIEAKMLAYHAAHPYKNLDLALINWCKKAEANGWDILPDPEPEIWIPR